MLGRGTQLNKKIIRYSIVVVIWLVLVIIPMTFCLLMNMPVHFLLTIQVFLIIGGIFTFRAWKTKKYFQVFSFLPVPTISAILMIGYFVEQFDLLEMKSALGDYIFCFTGLIILTAGICMFVYTFSSMRNLKRVCTVEIEAEYTTTEIIEEQKIYRPSFSFSYNNRNYNVHCDSREHIKTDNDAKFILRINPNNPEEYFETNSSYAYDYVTCIFYVMLGCISFVWFLIRISH